MRAPTGSTAPARASCVGACSGLQRLWTLRDAHGPLGGWHPAGGPARFLRCGVLTARGPGPRGWGASVDRPPAVPWGRAASTHRESHTKRVSPKQGKHRTEDEPGEGSSCHETPPKRGKHAPHLVDRVPGWARPGPRPAPAPAPTARSGVSAAQRRSVRLLGSQLVSQTPPPPPPPQPLGSRTASPARGWEERGALGPGSALSHQLGALLRSGLGQSIRELGLRTPPSAERGAGRAVGEEWEAGVVPTPAAFQKGQRGPPPSTRLPAPATDSCSGVPAKPRPQGGPPQTQHRSAWPGQALGPVSPAPPQPCSLRPGVWTEWPWVFHVLQSNCSRQGRGASHDVQTRALPGAQAACPSATPAPVTADVRGGLDAQPRRHLQVSEAACAVFMSP